MTASPTFDASIVLVTLAGASYALASIGLRRAPPGSARLAVVALVATQLAVLLGLTGLLSLTNLTAIWLGLATFETLMVIGYATVTADAPGAGRLAGRLLLLGGFVTPPRRTPGQQIAPGATGHRRGG